ncbi:neutral zinc metallopeptidase [Streptosporangiaceae bacterium NEAU-GS5]|nr:neutral zinc metallopeptidase [Streptosporangiaceae bacterium NEAU-GS5]
MRRAFPLIAVGALLSGCAGGPLHRAVPQAAGAAAVTHSPAPAARASAKPKASAKPTKPVKPSASPVPTLLMPPLMGDSSFSALSGRRAAEANPLYATGRAAARCRLSAPRQDSWKSLRRYLDAVSGCLDRLWSRQFGAARLYFTPPERVYARHKVKGTPCGTMPSDDATGTYCGANRTYYLLIEPPYSRPWSTAWLAELTAHEYGHHVQNMSYILDYETRLYSDSTTKAQEDLASRRLELQAECLAGVAARGMGSAMAPWREFADDYIGEQDKKWRLDHGELATQLRWLKRGYDSGSPRTCNTWTAAKKDVT